MSSFKALLQDDYVVLIQSNLFGVTVKSWLIYIFLLNLSVNVHKILLANKVLQSLNDQCITYKSKMKRSFK